MEAQIEHITDISGIDTWVVNDINDLNNLKNSSSTLENCIVFMAEKFACGVDVKFASPNATVIVYKETPKPRHLIR
jgi:hypothetical protein